MNKKTRQNSPFIARLFLAHFLPERQKQDLLGDYEEVYLDVLGSKGRFVANLWYMMQIIILIPITFSESTKWSLLMLRNYTKIALRTIKRHKGFSFINITGLALGISCCVLIALFVFYELSFDKFHTDAKDIYRVTLKYSYGGPQNHFTYTPAPLMRTMMNEFPEIEQGVRIWELNDVSVQLEESKHYVNDFFAVDSTFFDLFHFPLIKGNSTTALNRPNQVIITREIAQKFFGDTDPIGKEITVNLVTQEFRCIVSGVCENIPNNSHFRFDFLLSMTSSTFAENNYWFTNDFRTYFRLRSGSDVERLQAQLPPFVTRHLFGSKERYNSFTEAGNFWEYYLQPLTGIHLDSDLAGEFQPNGSRSNVMSFTLIAVLVLLIACANFINLSTARSSIRLKEIGIRKVVGSNRVQLMKQFLFESVFISSLSLILACIIMLLLFPSFSNMTGIPVEFISSHCLYIVPGLLVFILCISIVAGIYPAFVLSACEPINTLNRRSIGGAKKPALRNTLVIVQFTISITLIISLAVFYRQLDFMQNKNLGFEKEQVLLINNTQILGRRIEAFKNSIRSNANILNAAASNTVPGKSFNGTFYRLGEDKTLVMNNYFCDHDFAETLSIKMVEGRFLSKDFSTDSSAIILNQQAVKELELEDPLGKEIFGSFGDGLTFTIVGIINDFNYESMQEKVRPLAMMYFLRNLKWHPPRHISVKMQTNNIKQTIHFLKDTWKSFSTNVPFEYAFLDDEYDKLYRKEIQAGKVISLFSILAILIACLGLFGLVSFITDGKIKEIGIRKVLGASQPGILLLLSNAILRGIYLSNILAWPIAYFAMNKWLDNFAYQTKLSLWIFVFSGLATLLIALFTISYQTIKAARANPIESLRYE